LAAAVVDGRIHAIGGASSFGGGAGLSAAHEVYDPKARRWRRLGDLPEARDHLAATAFGGRVHVVGGRKLSLTTNVARLDVYDAERAAWSRGPDMPTARGGLAAAAVDGRVFVFGGEEPSGTFGQVEVYDIGTRRWSRAPDLPTPRHGLGAAAIGSRIYVVGGGPRPGLTVSGATEILVRRS
jgi:N-acetylneuraminic acid mutarotase